MQFPTWTAERIKTIRTLWADGYSATAIADALACGFSRNAVLGKLHRLGLTSNKQRQVRNVPVTETQIEARRQNIAVARESKRLNLARKNIEAAAMASPVDAMLRELMPLLPRAVPSDEPSPIGNEVFEPRNITMLALMPNSCRWPYDTARGFRFCGHAQFPGSSYCQHHKLKSIAKGYFKDRESFFAANKFSQSTTAGILEG